MVVPKVVAFDLDATLWFPEMYQVYLVQRVGSHRHAHCVF